jgi:diketogulonate reductase-like aldo/keto reductase
MHINSHVSSTITTFPHVTGNTRVGVNNPTSAVTDIFTNKHNTVQESVAQYLAQNPNVTPQEVAPNWLHQTFVSALPSTANSEAHQERLLVYLQNNQLTDAYALLTGTHHPLEHEIQQKHNPFAWLHKQMLKNAQAQPAVSVKPSEAPHIAEALSSLDNFKAYVATTRHTINSALPTTVISQGALAVAENTSTQHPVLHKIETALNTVLGKPAHSTLATPEAVQTALNAVQTAQTQSADVLETQAVAHALRTNPESQQKVVLEWVTQQLQEQLKHLPTASTGEALLSAQQQEYLLAVVTEALQDPKLATLTDTQAEQYLLKKLQTATQMLSGTHPPLELLWQPPALLPEHTEGLAPVTKKIVETIDGVGKSVLATVHNTIVQNAHSPTGFTPAQLQTFPEAFQTPEAFVQFILRSRNEVVQHQEPAALAFAKTLVETPTVLTGLVQTYQTYLEEETKRLTQQLAHLASQASETATAQLKPATAPVLTHRLPLPAGVTLSTNTATNNTVNNTTKALTETVENASVPHWKLPPWLDDHKEKLPWIASGIGALSLLGGTMAWLQYQSTKPSGNNKQQPTN